MCRSQLFGEEKMINWEDKVGVEKMWKTCKSYLKEIYAKKKRYNKATKGHILSETNVKDKNIVSGESIRDMFKEMSDISRWYQEQTQQMTTTNDDMVKICQQLM